MKNKFKALLFDLNETLLDLTEVRKSVANALNGGDEVVSLWFETMLHYSLVANASGEYHNFSDIGAAALVMLSQNRNIQLDMNDAKKVLAPIRSAPPHQDVPAALQDLSDKGYRVAVLTNSPRDGMIAQLQNAGIDTFFDEKLSVQDIGIYKPDRHVYRWAAHKMELTPNDCLFIAAHGWDVAGAKAAGMHSAFLSRPGQNLYPLAPKPTLNVPDLKQLSLRL